MSRKYIDKGMMLPDGITEKEQIFVHAHLGGKNITESMKEAGLVYADAAKRGFALLREPHIRKYVKEQQLAIQEAVKEDFRHSQESKAMKIVEGIRDLEENITDRTRVASWLAIKALISEHNKMFGHYAPIKTENITYDVNEEIKRTKEVMPKFELIHMPKKKKENE